MSFKVENCPEVIQKSASFAFSKTTSKDKPKLPVPCVSSHRYWPPASFINCEPQLEPLGKYQVPSKISPAKTLGLFVAFLAKAIVFLYSFSMLVKIESAIFSLPYKAPKNLIHSAFPNGVCSFQSPFSMILIPLFSRLSKVGFLLSIP